MGNFLSVLECDSYYANPATTKATLEIWVALLLQKKTSRLAGMNHTQQNREVCSLFRSARDGDHH
jgi:hypothetical protein